MSVLSADSDSRLFSDNDGERVYFSDCPQNLVQFNLRKYPIITTSVSKIYRQPVFDRFSGKMSD
jgi:hypothetical protein